MLVPKKRPDRTNEISLRTGFSFLSVPLSASILVAVAWKYTHKAEKASHQACGDFDTRNAIEQISTTANESSSAIKSILERAGSSPICRTEIIRDLRDAMDSPSLNLVSNQREFFLWSNGSKILGDLKAVEALDLLIDHLNLNDGLYSSSMCHQPAVGGVEAMGDVAIPKLTAALQRSPNRDIRLAAALCLGHIGSSDAIGALKQSLDAQTDQCVHRYIELSITPENKIEKKDGDVGADEWHDVNWQKILAFRCGN